MNSKRKFQLILLMLPFLTGLSVQGQNENQETLSNESYVKSNPRYGDKVRGSNAFTLGVGAAVINGDYVDPKFELYFHGGYKRYFSPLLNINISYHKFNLAYEDVFNEGFMSFDLNLEANLMPYSTFTPFVFAGGGLHASNYFETTQAKIQGGAGIEYLLSPQVGLKLSADYNHIFDDELDGRVFGDSDDIYWRMSFGLNVYFGGFSKDKKIKGNEPTVKKANPIDGGY